MSICPAAGRREGESLFLSLSPGSALRPPPPHTLSEAAPAKQHTSPLHASPRMYPLLGLGPRIFLGGPCPEESPTLLRRCIFYCSRSTYHKHSSLEQHDSQLLALQVGGSHRGSTRSHTDGPAELSSSCQSGWSLIWRLWRITSFQGRSGHWDPGVCGRGLVLLPGPPTLSP